MFGLLFNRFTLYAAIAALAFAGAYSYKSTLIQRGYDQAMAEVQEAENDKLRELLRENSRLVGIVEKLNAKAKQQEQDIKAFRTRQRVDAQRLRDQEADHQRALAAASAEAIRNYASYLDGHIDECRGMVESLSAESAACSTTAHTLNDYLKERP